MNNYLIKLTVSVVLVFAFACGDPEEGANRPGDDASAGEEDDAAQEPDKKKDAGRGQVDAKVDDNNVDECADPALNDCDENADCTDIVGGSYECQCKTGYEGDGKSCEDINECEGDTNTCNAEATCTNTEGGFECECNDGFEGDGKECEDIDECADSSLNDCEENEQCRNTRGSYRCECVPPFGEDEDGECRPLCEVELKDPDLCDPNAICRININGEAECVQCQFPYFGDGKECEQDDACDNLDCGDNAVCVEGDTDDSRECQCAIGFEGDPEQSCADIDECADEGDNDCESDTSECLNLDGGYYCNCNDGYENKDGSCVNINECEYQGDDYPCDKYAECEDRTPEEAPPFFECTCKEGFRGTGTSCTDIIECTDEEFPHDCGEHSKCKNLIASGDGPGYECDCDDGYTGGGIGKDCYCDLSGYWAMKQEQTVEWEAVKLGGATLFDEGSIDLTIWELFRLEYDGDQIKIKRKGCTQSDTPHLVAGSMFNNEIYSTYIPKDVIATYTFGESMPIVLKNAEPGSDVEAPEEEAFISGIVLEDAYNSDWPVWDRGEGDPEEWPPDPVKAWDGSGTPPVPRWEDSDEDGELGVTVWQRGPNDDWCHCVEGYELCEAHSYPPTWISEGEDELRTVCTSTAGRATAQIVGELDSCKKITGEVLTDPDMTNIRVYSCIVVPDSLWDPEEDHSCYAEDWVEARNNYNNEDCEDKPCLCNEEQVEFLDNTNPEDNSTTTFEMIKIEDLDREPSCGEVVGAFAALPPLECSE